MTLMKRLNGQGFRLFPQGLQRLTNGQARRKKIWRNQNHEHKAQDIANVEELFEPLGLITHRKMMGGLSIYCDGQIFSILDSESTLYLKAKDVFAEEMENAGARQFGAETGRTMGYWTMPDDALDDPDSISDWARRALSHL